MYEKKRSCFYVVLVVSFQKRKKSFDTFHVRLGNKERNRHSGNWRRQKSMIFSYLKPNSASVFPCGKLFWPVLIEILIQ